MRPTLRSFQLSLAAGLALGTALTAQTAPVSGTRPARLIIRNATVVDGNGTPAKRPFDIVVEDKSSRRWRRSIRWPCGRNGASRRIRADASTAEIDATGKYVTARADQRPRASTGRARRNGAADRLRAQDLARVRHHLGPRRRQRHEESARLARRQRQGHARRAAHLHLPAVRPAHER